VHENFSLDHEQSAAEQEVPPAIFSQSVGVPVQLADVDQEHREEGHVPAVVYELQGVSAEHVPVPPLQVQPVLEVHWSSAKLLHGVEVPVHEPVDHVQYSVDDRQAVLVVNLPHAEGVPLQELPVASQVHPATPSHQVLLG
jgi:hypothetical protein